MEVVVGIDVATADVRAEALDARGRVQGRGQAPLAAPTSPRPGHHEQDARSWGPAAEEALRSAAAGLTVVAVSVCATSGTIVALDQHGAPIGPALMYDDQRDRLPWLADNRPGIGRVAHASDVVVAHLVGHATPTDWSHALKSGYDPEARAWRVEGVPAHLLPDVVAPATVVGRAAVGGDVRLGMTDGCASQLAAGAAEPGRYVSVLGTTLVLKGATAERLSDPTGVVYSHRHPDGWWLPGGASNTGGGALQDFDDLASWDERARQHGPARHVTYPLVGRGERFPFLDPDAEAFVVGEPADEVDRYRAILEGVAFVERLGYERLRALGAPAPSTIVATGRGSASGVWNLIRATVLGVPLVAAPHAGTARGAAILAAAGSLHPDLAEATAAMAATGEQVEPDESERDVLEASYRRFVSEIKARAASRPGVPATPPVGFVPAPET